jgi:UV DNA damage endonuclease
MTDQRVGFCCKFVPSTEFDSAKETKAWLDKYNVKTTTVAALDKLSRKDATAKLIGIIENNVQVLKNQFDLMGTWPLQERMVRIGSDLLPVRTHENYKSVYEDFAMIRTLRQFGSVGELARQHDIRLSMHPGQFTMLVSHTDATISRSLEDLDYHAEVFRLMGYDARDLRQEINIHGGAQKEGFVEEFLRNRRRLAADTQQWLSIENDEFSYCLDDILPLAEHVKIVLDVNHYWIHQGQYMDAQDTRLKQVIASWRGARPELHVSFPDETLLVGHDPHVMPNLPLLEAQGIRKNRLRAHSQTPWNTAIMKYVHEFWDRFDICFEGKSKNLASKKLLSFFHNLNK